MHPARGSCGRPARGSSPSRRPTPFYLGLLVGGVVVRLRDAADPGPTARSFRVFVIAGARRRWRCARRSCSSARWTPRASRSPSSRALRLATILVVFGTFNAVTDPFGRGPARAATVPRAGARGRARAVDRAAHDRERRHACARRSGCAGSTSARLRSLPAARGPGARDRDGGGRHARRDRWTPAGTAAGGGRATGPQPWTVGGRRRSPPRRCAAAASSSPPSFGGWGGLHPPTSPIAWPRGRPGAARRDRPARRRPGCCRPDRASTSRAREQRCASCDGVVTFTYPDADRARARRRRRRRSPRGRSRSRSGRRAPASRRSCAPRTGSSRTSPAGRSTGRVTVGRARHARAPAPRGSPTSSRSCRRTPRASFVLDRVEDELAYGMENLGVDPAHMRRRVEEMLDLLDIEPLRRPQRPDALRRRAQRVAIAAALAAGPRILVLDEPTSPARPAGRRGRDGRAPAARPRPRDDGAARRAPARARRGLGRPGDRVRSTARVDAGRPRRRDPPTGDRGRRSRALGPAGRAGTRCRSPCATRAGWRATSRGSRRSTRGRRRAAGEVARPRCVACEARHGDATALRGVDLEIRAGEVVAADGSQRRRQDHAAADDRRRPRRPRGGRSRSVGGAPRPGVDVGALPAGARVDPVHRHRATTRCGRRSRPAGAAGDADAVARAARASRASRGATPATSRRASACWWRPRRSRPPARRSCCSTSPRAGSIPRRRSGSRGSFARTPTGGGAAVSRRTTSSSPPRSPTRVVMLAGGEVDRRRRPRRRCSATRTSSRRR